MDVPHSTCLFHVSVVALQEACSFTDPTLSFSGLSTYKRNIASLQGVLNALVINSASILYSCQLQQVGRGTSLVYTDVKSFAAYLTLKTIRGQSLT